MKRLLFLLAALLCCAAAVGRPQFIQPTHTIADGFTRAHHVAVDGDWIIADVHHPVNIDPNDDWNFDWWEKVLLYRRAASGQWLLERTLADEYALYNTDERDAPHHGVAIQNGVLAFSTNSGLRIYELVAGNWVPRTVTGAAPGAPFALAFDGATLLASTDTCSPAATAYAWQSDGSWAASDSLQGIPDCEEVQYGDDLAVSGPLALVAEDAREAYGSDADHVRVFERSGGAWHAGPLLPSPPAPDVYFGPIVALRADVALVAGGDNGTHVYRRGPSGFAHAGTVPILVTALDRPFAQYLELGTQLGVQTYYGDWSWADVAVLQPNAQGGYDHAATLAATQGTGQHSVSLSGRRVVSIGRGIHIYDLPATFNVPATVMEDFETGTDGWTALAGRFAVAQRGATRVFRQSSLAGDAVAVHSADLGAQTISADIRPTGFSGNDRWVGLMARYIDENNHYYLTLRNNNRISIRAKVDGVIKELYWTELPMQVGQLYRVMFEVVGDRLTYYLDGVKVIDIYDPALTHGRAGVRTYRASADFDNVVISATPRVGLARHGFEGGIGWGFTEAGGTWSWAPNQLRQTSTTGDARIVHGRPTSDQVLTVNARLDSVGMPTTGSHWFGAMARYTDASNYYYLSLRSSNELSLRKLVNGSITVLGTVPFTVTPGQPYALRLEAVGTKLRAYVNGEMLLEANDTSHASGRYGVLTYRAAATFGSYLAWAP